MESFAKPIRDLSDALSWFIRVRELRLAYVATSPELRGAVLRIARSKEAYADNASPFVQLEDPFTRANEGWLERVERLREQHEARRKRMAEEGQVLPALLERPAVTDPFAAFGAQLVQLLALRAAGTDGLVVIMAPARVELPALYCERLTRLLDPPDLAAVRWIIIDSSPPLDSLIQHLGQRAMAIECRVDPDEAQRELEHMLSAAENAAMEISGPARVGAAWPRGVSPPPRPDRPSANPEEIDKALRAEGFDLPLAGRVGVELARAVLRGAQQ
jgi:hypothetical protein